MAKEVTTQTYSTVQRKELIGLGVSLADIRASEAEGTTFEDAIELAHAAKTANDDDLQADADRTAKATKRALRPGTRHIRVSASTTRPAARGR